MKRKSDSRDRFPILTWIVTSKWNNRNGRCTENEPLWKNLARKRILCFDRDPSSTEIFDWRSIEMIESYENQPSLARSYEMFTRIISSLATIWTRNGRSEEMIWSSSIFERWRSWWFHGRPHWRSRRRRPRTRPRGPSQDPPRGSPGGTWNSTTGRRRPIEWQGTKRQKDKRQKTKDKRNELRNDCPSAGGWGPGEANRKPIIHEVD